MPSSIQSIASVPSPEGVLGGSSVVVVIGDLPTARQPPPAGSPSKECPTGMSHMCQIETWHKMRTIRPLLTKTPRNANFCCSPMASHMSKLRSGVMLSGSTRLQQLIAPMVYLALSGASRDGPGIAHYQGDATVYVLGRSTHMRLELLFSETHVRSSGDPSLGRQLEQAKLRAELDRRAHRRLSAHELRWLQVARFEHGPSVTLIDLSVGGHAAPRATIGFAPARLRALEQLVGSNQVVVPLRRTCRKSRASSEGLLYRGACAFRRPLFELPDAMLQSSTVGFQFSMTTPSASPSSSPPKRPVRASHSSGRPGGFDAAALSRREDRSGGSARTSARRRWSFHLLARQVGALLRASWMIVPCPELSAVFFAHAISIRIRARRAADVCNGPAMDVAGRDHLPRRRGQLPEPHLNYRPEGSASSLSLPIQVRTTCASPSCGRLGPTTRASSGSAAPCNRNTLLQVGNLPPASGSTGTTSPLLRRERTFHDPDHFGIGHEVKRPRVTGGFRPAAGACPEPPTARDASVRQIPFTASSAACLRRRAGWNGGDFSPANQRAWSVKSAPAASEGGAGGAMQTTNDDGQE